MPQQYSGPHILPSQTTAPEPTYSNLDQHQYLQAQITRQSSVSHFGSPHVPAYGHSAPQSRKRSRTDDDTPDYKAFPAFDAPSSHSELEIITEPTTHGHGHHAQSQSLLYQRSPFQTTSSLSQRRASQQNTQQGQMQSLSHSLSPQAQVQQHHHHRLPNQPPPAKQPRHGEPSPPAQEEGPPSMVGQHGMPEPAARPRGPKLKFTREDDTLLVELKETKNLTWKQIADFFPGRSSGTLQVRYCTKLRAKTTVWSDDMVSYDCLSLLFSWLVLFLYTLLASVVA